MHNCSKKRAMREVAVPIASTAFLPSAKSRDFQGATLSCGTAATGVGVAMFFETGDEFAAWLEKHGADKSELIVGY